jgi:hypothetical protein
MVGCSQETVPTKASQLCQLSTAAKLNLKMKPAQLAFGIRSVILQIEPPAGLSLERRNLSGALPQRERNA